MEKKATELEKYETPRDLITQPKKYLEEKSKTLADRIDQIKLNKETEEGIKNSAGTKIVRDKILGAFKVGQVVHAFLSWNETIEKDIKSAKREVLLSSYFDKNDKNEEAIEQLKKFVTDPRGNTIFNKVIRILDDSPPDIELTNHLAAALKHAAQSQFEDMFEEHKYALSQIEQLTPQALTILADHPNWPVMQLSGFSADGGKVTSDWLEEFEDCYSKSKNITDAPVRNRIQHSIGELIGRRFVEARMLGSFGESNARCVLTELGRSLVPYLSSPTN